MEQQGPTEGQPLVVYGAASHLYDFGADHPLTPRRFGPGIDMLRRLGATLFAEPSHATDEQLLRVHDPSYLALVRMLSEYPEAASMAGWESVDTPPFYGMHDAAAVVAGGSLAAMDRILAGDARHVFHPGGGLHHAHAGRSGGFCVYNDVALAIARARDAGHRVLYVDLDVHHGDGVESIFWNDPSVLTVSIHESGLHLFPGSGFVEDRGGHDAPGTAANVPLEPGTSDDSWLTVVELVVPQLAEAFGPTMLVTQHGSDSHVLDPLAHLEVTTAAMWRAALLLDHVAHEHTDGCWLATGGGGYDVYGVVPRAWGLVWLAQAHQHVPDATPEGWGERWTGEASRYGRSGAAVRHNSARGHGHPAALPEVMLDPPDTAPPEADHILERDLAAALTVLDHSLVVLRERREL